MMTQEGTIEIPLEEFWTWVQHNYASRLEGMEIVYGVPRIPKGNGTMEIDFAASTEGSPHDWGVKPKAVLQWDAETSPDFNDLLSFVKSVKDWFSSVEDTEITKKGIDSVRETARKLILGLGEPK